MASVNIGDLACGMVLAGDVCGAHGRKLLAGGTVLAENHLRVLRIWGVSQVDIVAGNPAADASCPSAVGPDPEALARADARFAIAGRGHPAVDELYRQCLKDMPVVSGPGPLPPEPHASDLALPALPQSPEALVQADPALASFPDVYFRLQEAINDPGASAGHIAGIIGRDPGLAASLLRLANSPLYGLPRPIDSLARGVMVIGARELTQLALGVAVVGRFRDIPDGCLTMRQTWEHAVGCAVLAQVLAVHLGLPRERLFVAGLLHDLGRLVLLRRFPLHMAKAVALARRQGQAVAEAEREVFGFDHAAVGATLLAHWRLPPDLAEAVGGHHGDGETGLDAAVVHVADVAAVAGGFGSNGSPLVPPLSGPAFDALNIAPSVLPVALSQARRQVGDIVATLVS